MESIAISIAKSLTAGVPLSSDPQLTERVPLQSYLQECDDVLAAILARQEELAQIVSGLGKDNSKSPIFSVVAQALFCRVLEALMMQGFSAQEYYELVSSEIVTGVVEYQSQCKPIFDDRLFAPQSLLRNIVTGGKLREMFVAEGLWKEISNYPSLAEECRNLLRAYVNWCHLGKGLRNEAIPEECDLLRSVYPLVFLSFLVVSNRLNEPEFRYVIYRLVRLEPCLVPIGGMPLWLQRRAALKLHESLGLEAFLPYGIVRPVLVYYLLVRDRLSAAEKEKLRDIVSRSKKLELQRNAEQKAGKAGEEFIRKMPAHVRTESLIMEYLA